MTSPPLPAPPQAAAKAGRPATASAQMKGKLLFALAAGVTRREAAAWVGCAPSMVAYYIRQDESFAGELARQGELVRLHPYLGMYRAARDSWPGCVALIDEWERRHGALTSDRLIAALEHTVAKVQGVEE